MVRKIKEGDTVIIDGAEYIFGESSAYAINLWLDVLMMDIPEEDTKIHLFRADRRGLGEFFYLSKIKEALER